MPFGAIFTRMRGCVMKASPLDGSPVRCLRRVMREILAGVGSIASSSNVECREGASCPPGSTTLRSAATTTAGVEVRGESDESELSALHLPEPVREGLAHRERFLAIPELDDEETLSVSQHPGDRADVDDRGPVDLQKEAGSSS